MRRFSFIAWIVPAILAGGLVCAPGAAAAPPPPMTVNVEPASGAIGSYFEVSGQPGQTSRAGNLKLTNQSGKRITVVLDPVRGLTASTLGSAYALHGTKAKGSAAWVVLGRRRVSLGPHGVTRIPVSVQVPGGAKPGDYLAGISVEAAKSASQTRLKGNLAISQVQRYAVGLVTSLPGPRHPLIKLTGVDLKREPAGVTFSILGRNEGNVILKNVNGKATISSGDKLVSNRKLGPGTFVTGTSIAYPLLVPSLHPEQGTTFRVQASLRYRGGVARIDRVVQFSAIDAKRQQAYGGPKADGGGNKLLLILLIAAALVGGGLAAREVRRRRLGRRAARPALAQAIAHSRASGEPLSVILVLGEEGQPSPKLAPAVRSCLRGCDQLLRPNGTGLMVIAPDTTPQAGEMLAAEIKRRLAREGSGASAVIPVTSAAEVSAEELLEAAGAAAPVETGSQPATNGAAVGRETGSAGKAVNDGGTEAPAAGSYDGSHRST
jgi:hypothetical protein